jgi:hypothetical protein
MGGGLWLIETEIVARDVLGKGASRLTHEEWRDCRTWVALRRLERKAEDDAVKDIQQKVR